MTTNSNADDYAEARQNIWFTANNETPDDGNLTGQCVTLDKWFFAEMTVDFPAPFMARGNARDLGHTLVSQGLATEVPFDNRRRGDIICYEYGTYGHTAVQLSGGRVFESNVNWSGVASRVVDGETVYASRIGSENEVWRSTKNPHIYRLKNYSEGGDDVIPTRDLLNSLFRNYRGREATDDEAKLYINTITYNDFIPILDSGTEHDNWVKSHGAPLSRDNVIPYIDKNLK